MADDQNKNGLGEEDEALLNELDADGENDEQSPLPRKVELDIDDMVFEDEEEEEGEEEEAEPEPELDLEEPEAEPAEEEPKPKGRRSKKKLLFIGLLALVPLLGLGAAAYLFLGDQSEPEVVQEPVTPSLTLKPFVINYAPREKNVATLVLTVTFPSPEIMSEFERQIIVFRDKIYRYAQGMGPGPIDDLDAQQGMMTDLSLLINRTLTKGPIQKLSIDEFKPI
jgi:flagellar basal body-associated protein FliL